MMAPEDLDDKKEPKHSVTNNRRSWCTAKTIVTFLVAAGLLAGAAVYVLQYQEDILKTTILHDDVAMIKREEFLLSNATDEQYLQVLQQWSDAEILEALGIAPRAWKKYKLGAAYCTPASSDWTDGRVQRRPTKTGLMFIKIPKCASSTGATVALRMATTIPREFGLNFSACENRLRHSNVRNMQYHKRDQRRSFLWSQVRDPTRRAISEYFHFFVSRRHADAENDDKFKKKVKTFAGTMMSKFIGTTHGSNPAVNIKKIFGRYNFVGLAERLEESTVILQLLLGLKPRNVLYMSSKKHGGYDGLCTFIQPAVLTPGMEEFFASPEWNRLNFWDNVLVKAVNASLDLTIEALGGRAVFEKHLNEFRKLRTGIEQACQDKIRMPCSANGRRQKDNDCLISDNGCGFDCMDAELAKLGAAGPLLLLPEHGDPNNDTAEDAGDGAD